MEDAIIKAKYLLGDADMGRFRKEKVTAEHSDILLSYNNVRSRKWRIRNLRQLLIEPSVVAHIASVLTIGSLLPSQFTSGSWNLFIIIMGIICTR